MVFGGNNNNNQKKKKKILIPVPNIKSYFIPKNYKKKTDDERKHMNRDNTPPSKWTSGFALFV
jgi:hypothetical protein